MKRPDWRGWLIALVLALTACGVMLVVANGCGHPMPMFKVTKSLGSAT